MGARRIGRLLAGIAIVLAASGAAAEAQVRIGSADAPRRGSWEAAGGVLWTGGFDIDSVDALLTSNAGNDAEPFTLFAVDGRVKSAAGLQGRVGFYLSRALSVEGGVRFTRPVVSMDVSDDAEDAPNVTLEETMSRYVFDGSLLFHFTGAAFAGGRGVPFVQAGAGYVRELHSGSELVETGAEYHAGGGIKLWFGTGQNRLGLRADLGVSFRDGGFGAEDSSRTLPFAGASLVFLF
jgi:hypothetical protein